ncbi:MAG: hypothetical protein IJO71_12960 [Microbacterium sp.]|jgi:hypothetical protein|uniref:hypothetical protein n=1 Tax=Microbacterium sp. TaxID=51671 RepID=UPI0025EDB04F|nr:hypothetical protein [Microbacterium sp.]MBQ9918091.1 hypothetical protein [Microbacterium sp.]
MYDLSSLFPTQERSDYPVSSRETSSEALGRMVGETGDSVTPPSRPSGQDLVDLVGPPMQSESAARATDLSQLVGVGPAAEMTGHVDISAALAQRVGRADIVDERGWQAPGAAQPARRPRFSGRRAFGSVNALSVAVAVVATAILCGSVALAVAQRVASDPAAEAMVSLREREAELQNENQVLTTARGLYTASLSDASALTDAAGAVLGQLTDIVDRSVLDQVDGARSSLAAVIASAPTIAVPEYERSVIDDGSLEDIAAAIDKVQVVKNDISESISEARAARSAVVAPMDSLKQELRLMGASIDAAAAEATRSHTAAADGFRSAVTDAAASVHAAHQSGRDGAAEMSDFAAAVAALRAEDERILEQRRSGSGGSGVRAPYVPGGSTGNTGTGTPPASDSTGASDPGTGSSDTGGGTPSPDPTAPTTDPDLPPETAVPLPTP